MVRNPDLSPRMSVDIRDPSVSRLEGSSAKDMSCSGKVHSVPSPTLPPPVLVSGEGVAGASLAGVAIPAPIDIVV